ncbi:hypothetical protein DM01DRAFT_316966 [Hesseltinella vesiculosa]|uniref:Uncharacterized protein n=1 Tax=Hesseltinella vesiculosa TaxID=101127 RepID=A0A1X2GPI3_9FUNG|nr:hypothetical protein DM01DRAFT_316966 [Hesseltinella vesiculosa]
MCSIAKTDYMIMLDKLALAKVPEKAWMLGEKNVTEMLFAYRKECLEDCNRYTALDDHFNELLAMSSVIVLQNRTGRLIGEEPCTQAITIWKQCLADNTRLHLTFMPSALNPTDSPSRLDLTKNSEWSISLMSFRKLDHRWGPHDVDAFASSRNHHLPHYLTWRYDPAA